MIGAIGGALQAGQLGASGVGASQLTASASATQPGTLSLGAEGASGGFGEALSSAISSLEQTQQSASGAAQSLATGASSDPESAVVTIDEAQLAMQLAGQIRAKATEAAQQIFQTQV